MTPDQLAALLILVAVLIGALMWWALVCYGFWEEAPEPDEAEEIEPRIIIRNYEPMTAREIRNALCVEEEHPLWRAVLQFIEQELEQCVEESSDPKASDSMRAYYAGGVRHLQRLEEFLIDQREQAVAARLEVEEEE
jgi:hypothetical protein